MGEAEAQESWREKQTDANPYCQAHADEFRDAKEALEANESKVGRQEKGSLSFRCVVVDSRGC